MADSDVWSDRAHQTKRSSGHDHQGQENLLQLCRFGYRELPPSHTQSLSENISEPSNQGSANERVADRQQGQQRAQRPKDAWGRRLSAMSLI